MNPADSRTDFHASMVRRVELARKAIEPYRIGRGRQAGLANALDVILDELHERLDLAWRVLSGPFNEHSPQQRIFRSQKAAELGMCYAAISAAYDELAKLFVIPSADRTEPTVPEIVKGIVREEKAANRLARGSQ